MARVFRRSLLHLPTVVLVLLAVGCQDSGTLLAPTGASLTLSTTASAVSFNGTAAITARILTSQGTAAQDGTMVTFATTLGAVTPSDVPTAGGVATTTFTGGVASGTALVTASSGTAGGSDGLRIAVGVAAVARILMTATPPTVPFGGGASSVSAIVVDANDNPLVGIPVTFSTTAGSSLTPANVKTDPKGSARTTLTTSPPATVTATGAAAPSDPGFGTVVVTQGSIAVAVAPQPVPVVTITPGANAVAQTPTTFTIAVTPAVGSATTIQSVSVSFGDGNRAELGGVSGAAITVQHVYRTGGSYTVSVTATDSGGGVARALAVIQVGFQAPVTVKIVAESVVPIPGDATKSLVTLTATVAPPSVVGVSYSWKSDDGQVATTTLNQVQIKFAKNRLYTVKADVTLGGSGQIVSGSLQFVVP